MLFRSIQSVVTNARTTGTVQNEFAILKRLRELDIPYAVRVMNEISTETATGTPVIGMEMCGMSLKSLVTTLWTKNKKSRVRDMTIVTRQIFQCLSKCHEMGIIHRDIKLDNIMLKSCEPLEIRIIDWGLARDVKTRDETLSMGRAGM